MSTYPALQYPPVFIRKRQSFCWMIHNVKYYHLLPNLSSPSQDTTLDQLILILHHPIAKDHKRPITVVFHKALRRQEIIADRQEFPFPIDFQGQAVFV